MYLYIIATVCDLALKQLLCHLKPETATLFKLLGSVIKYGCEALVKSPITFLVNFRIIGYLFAKV